MCNNNTIYRIRRFTKHAIYIALFYVISNISILLKMYKLTCYDIDPSKSDYNNLTFIYIYIKSVILIIH